MPLPWPQIALIVIAIAFCALAWYLIGLVRRIHSTLEHVDKTLNATTVAVSSLNEQLPPLLNRLGELEEAAQDAITDIRSKLDTIDTELVPLIREVKDTAQSYRQLERVIEEKINEDISPLLQEATEVANGVKDITGDIKARIHQTQDLFEAVNETGQSLRIATGIMRAGLTGLAVQVASIATGMKTSLEYLTENLISKGGGKK